MKKILCLLTLSLFVSQTSFAGAVNGEQTQSMIQGEQGASDDVQASIITGKVISPKKSPYVFVEYSTATCYIADAHGQWQDMIMMLSNDKTKKFLKIATNNAVKFF